MILKYSNIPSSQLCAQGWHRIKAQRMFDPWIIASLIFILHFVRGMLGGGLLEEKKSVGKRSCWKRSPLHTHRSNEGRKIGGKHLMTHLIVAAANSVSDS